MQKITNYFYSLIIALIIFPITAIVAFADQALISLFPLTNYKQSVSAWISPTDPDFDTLLLSKEMQQQRFLIFFNHYFGSSSPWNPEYISKIFRLRTGSNSLKSVELDLIHQFSNEGKSEKLIGYGENFRPYDKTWIENIADNINLSQFDGLRYQANQRGIAVDNLEARILPTTDVHFYSHKLAGQGYPFDNLQISALWIGTPVYIIGETQDRAWLLVITPDFIGWVKSTGIAYVNDTFIERWISLAKNKLIAITKTKTSLIDENGTALPQAYVGAVFPGLTATQRIKIMVPGSDADHHAVIKQVELSTNDATVMPLDATPHHFSDIMNTLINRPYGWGGMYFYNDCSAEFKSLFTPFGIWLPRHSSYQVTVGKLVDMSAQPPEERLSYLMAHGQRFLTLIYIGGHIVLYIGNYQNPNQNNEQMAMTFQNMWGLYPNPPIRRAVIGQSVLLPLLLQFPEDSTLASQAAKPFFQVSYLSELPSSNLLKESTIDLRSLMYPETTHD